MVKIKVFIKKICWYLFRVFRIDEKKIVVDCFNGKGYLGNPKLIVDELYKMDKSLKIICLVCYDIYGDAILPNYVKKVKYNSVRSIYEHVTAKLWIGNSRKCYFARKRKTQIYIQAWHGGIGAKKVEKDAINSLSKEYVEYAQKDAAMTDYMVASSTWQKDVFKRSFWYNGDFIELGWPEYDVFLKKSDNKKIRSKYRKLFNISNDKKILLYCPTFRDDENLDCYDLDFNKIMDVLSKKDKKEWVTLIKLHPNISNKADYFKYSEKIINASFVKDMNELEVFSDVMITDYSSTMFDFAMMKKTCYIYANDYDEYVKNRDFNLPYKDMPFPFAKTQKELEDNIINFNINSYHKDLDNYMKNLGLNQNPNSSKDIAKFILKEVFKR